MKSDTSNTPVWISIVRQWVDAASKELGEQRARIKELETKIAVLQKQLDEHQHVMEDSG